MQKIALNFICKNEHHVIERMLSSALPVIDLIVAVDTGSTDKTIELINEFGKRQSISTYVFQRPFDNFGNSRNFALDKLREVALQLNWNLEEVWGLFIDCDEMLQVSSGFRKELISKDIYVAMVQGNGQTFIRQFLFHLSKRIWWEGPIHEVLQWEKDSVTIDIVEGAGVICESAGASWKGDLEAKFLNYARLLVEYIEQGHRDFRWVYYAGNSYTCAAEHCKSKTRKKEWKKIAMQYYEQADKIGAPTIDEQIILQRQMGESRELTEDKWAETKTLFLETYNIDPRRAESIATIISHYISQRRWELSRIFSSFAVKTFHSRDPFGQGVAESEGPLYQWKLLLYYFLCCQQTGRKEEAKILQKTIRNISRNESTPLSYKDLVYIQYNTPPFLTLRAINPFKKKFAI